ADRLDAAPVEFRLELRHLAELGRADRGEILGMREQHHPFRADPVVEADRAVGRILGEIGCCIAEAKSHCHLLPHKKSASARSWADPGLALAAFIKRPAS